MWVKINNKKKIDPSKKWNKDPNPIIIKEELKYFFTHKYNAINKKLLKKDWELICPVQIEKLPKLNFNNKNDNKITRDISPLKVDLKKCWEIK